MESVRCLAAFFASSNLSDFTLKSLCFLFEDAQFRGAISGDFTWMEFELHPMQRALGWKRRLAIQRQQHPRQHWQAKPVTRQ